MAEKPLIKRMDQFLRANHGKFCMGVFTGYSGHAFNGYIHLVRAWLNADDDNRAHIEAALTAIVKTLQPGEMHLARTVIAGVGDWLVVEDTNIAWSMVRDGAEVGDRGARGGLQDYVDGHPGEFRQMPSPIPSSAMSPG